MQTPSDKLSPTVVGISLLINITICCSAILILFRSDQIYVFNLLVEIQFFQVASLISWPIPLFLWAVEFLLQGSFPALGDLALILVYPAGITCSMITLFSKRNTWILFLLTHLLIVISFLSTWYAVINGYDFMVG